MCPISFFSFIVWSGLIQGSSSSSGWQYPQAPGKNCRLQMRMQPCTIIRAKREEWRLTTSISVYATLTPTKVQAFYQCRLGALRIRFDPICDRADNYVFWTFLRGLCDCPLKNMQHCTASHAPKGGQNGSTALCIFFYPFA